MSYSTYETTESSGQPVELYKFESTAFSTNYYYTSGDTEVVYSGNTYTPLYIKRTQPELSKEKNAQQIVVTIDRTNPLAQKWLSFIPNSTVWLTVYRYHRTDPDNEFIVFWRGKVRGVERLINEVQFVCQLIDSAFDRNGLRRSFGTTCPHLLYGDKCKAIKASFSYSATISGVNGVTITSTNFSAFPDGYWTAGTVERANGEVRYVFNHVGNDVELLYPFDNLPNGEVVTVVAGCLHDGSTCINKFNNFVNFGGIPFLSTSNPFTIKLIN